MTRPIAASEMTMSPRLVRYTLTLASAIASGGCATEAPKPAEAPLSGVTSLLEGYVNAEEVRCSWGLAESCTFTGEAYHLGMGVPRDLQRALSYFQRACSLGSTDGCV